MTRNTTKMPPPPPGVSKPPPVSIKVNGVVHVVERNSLFMDDIIRLAFGREPVQADYKRNCTWFDGAIQGGVSENTGTLVYKDMVITI